MIIYPHDLVSPPHHQKSSSTRYLPAPVILNLTLWKENMNVRRRIWVLIIPSSPLSPPPRGALKSSGYIKPPNDVPKSGNDDGRKSVWYPTHVETLKPFFHCGGMLSFRYLTWTGLKKLAEFRGTFCRIVMVKGENWPPRPCWYALVVDLVVWEK